MEGVGKAALIGSLAGGIGSATSGATNSIVKETANKGTKVVIGVTRGAIGGAASGATV